MQFTLVLKHIYMITNAKDKYTGKSNENNKVWTIDMKINTKHMNSTTKKTYKM